MIFQRLCLMVLLGCTGLSYTMSELLAEEFEAHYIQQRSSCCNAQTILPILKAGFEKSVWRLKYVPPWCRRSAEASIRSVGSIGWKALNIATRGYAQKVKNLIDPFVDPKKSRWPIKGDAQLGSAFEKEEWLAACLTGDVRTVKHFLEVPEYAEFLNEWDETDRPLSYAAYGYLLGTEQSGTDSIEAFQLLVEHEAVEKSFAIKAGHSRVPFDEWLLQDLTVEQEQQSRLEKLQGLLKVHLSQERCEELELRQSQKDEAKAAREAHEAELRKAKFNKTSFITGWIVAVGTCYWYYHMKKQRTTHRTHMAT